MKKIVIIIAIIVGLIILFFVGSSLYSTYKHNKEISNLPDYYQQLALECESKGSYSCCMASVNNMANGNYKLAPGDTLVESGCPDGFQGNMLKCIDSFRWCESIE
jgi:hypothetical protein|tara:strand:- start:93 stop:407 length:315 start_codon:yes stop_codon:yes gene_type:complete